MLAIDVGCGYNEDLHYPNYDADIMLEPFLNNAKSEFINKLNNPIMASAEDLPFRSKMFDYIQCRAVIEHLNNPIKALLDIKRIMKDKADAYFIIPIIVNHFKHYLILIFYAFPYGIYEAFILTRRMRRNIKKEGLQHKIDIRPEHFKDVFINCLIMESRYRHSWFHGYFGRIVKKFLTRGREPIKDVQGYYEIFARK